MKNAGKYLADPIIDSCLVIPKRAPTGLLAGAVVGEAVGSAARRV